MQIMSDSDDLEEALRENLKLRGELAAKAKEGGEIGYRLGWVLYWICLALGGAWLLLIVAIDNFEFVRNFPSDPWGTLATVIIPAITLYGLGRAFRYVLSGQ